MVSTVRSPSRTSATCDDLLNSFASALPTKNPQRRGPAGQRSGRRPGVERGAWLLLSGREDLLGPVEKGDERGAEEQRPDDGVARVRHVLQREGERADAAGEGQARGAAAGRGVRVGEHEEGEEQQAARLELVQQHRCALAEIEDAPGAQRDPGYEEGEAHVAAEG